MASTGGRWGEIGDRSREREKHNEQSIEQLKKCGAEGLGKSVINKRQSLMIEQSLTKARKTHHIIRSHCSPRIPVNTHTIE